MNSQQILEELLGILEDNNVEIRKEAMAGAAGGLCNIKGKNVFFLDTQAGSLDAAAAIARIIGQITDVETIYIRPELREFIENNKS